MPSRGDTRQQGSRSLRLNYKGLGGDMSPDLWHTGARHHASKQTSAMEQIASEPQGSSTTNS